MTARQKGWFHVIVAVAAVSEYLTARTKSRKFVLGVCAGYHVQAAFGHFVKEGSLRETF